MTEARTERAVDVLIVGAGPAGLSAATELARAGAGTVEVIEREQAAGGIPRHSRHTGYGLRDLHRILTGPSYARHHIEAALAAGAHLRTGVTVTGWSPLPGASARTESGASSGPGHRRAVPPAAPGLTAPRAAAWADQTGAAGRSGSAWGEGRDAAPLVVTTTGPGGLERIRARAVLLATGARERPRSARLVPGSRPAGVYTTGQLQQEVYVRHQRIGRRAVVVGTEHVAYSAALTLRHAGVEVRALLTDLPRQQSYAAFHHALRLAYTIPVLAAHTVTAIHGRDRVTGVGVRRPDGTEAVIACDTVVFTGDWIPDHELARRAGLAIDPGTRGPAVTATLSTTHPGVFAAGNLVHPVETADNAALAGRAAARSILAHLNAAPPTTPSASGTTLAASPTSDLVPVRAGGALRWAAPNLLHPDARPDRDRLILWAATIAHHPHIEIRQKDRVLWSTRRHRPLVPGRPYYLPSHWLPAIDPHGAPIEITTV